MTQVKLSVGFEHVFVLQNIMKATYQYTIYIFQETGVGKYPLGVSFSNSLGLKTTCVETSMRILYISRENCIYVVNMRIYCTLLSIIDDINMNKLCFSEALTECNCWACFRSPNSWILKSFFRFIVVSEIPMQQNCRPTIGLGFEDRMKEIFWEFVPPVSCSECNNCATWYQMTSNYDLFLLVLNPQSNRTLVVMYGVDNMCTFVWPNGISNCRIVLQHAISLNLYCRCTPDSAINYRLS